MLIWSDFQTGGYRVMCPACGTNPRKKNMRVTVDHDGYGVAFCHACHYTEAHKPDERTFIKAPRPFVRAVQAVLHETLSAYGQETLSQTSPVHGAGADYLHARHCPITPEDSDLRFHPNLRHPSGYTGPALVWVIRDALTDQIISMGYTWIKSTGEKADVHPARLLLKDHRKKGGVVKLWPNEAVTYGLGIAEGIETALSLAHAYQPVWSCVDAGNLANFPLLAGVESLVIGADNDPAGQKAARTCATRWADADREVMITRQAENDLNDTLKEVAA